jgi:predicted outer membrane protein
MDKVTRRTALALAMPAALLTLASCAPPTAASSPGGSMNAADLEFVTQAYNLILFDIQEGELAPTSAKTQAVRDIAAKLVSDARTAQARLDPILKQAGIVPPTDLRSDLRIRLFQARRVGGRLDFDKRFIDDQIASHQEFLDRYDMMASTPGENPQLVALNADVLPLVRQNTATLHAIQKQLIMMGS